MTLATNFFHNIRYHFKQQQHLCLRYMGTLTVCLLFFSNGDNFFYFLFAFLDNEILPKKVCVCGGGGGGGGVKGSTLFGKNLLP